MTQLLHNDFIIRCRRTLNLINFNGVELHCAIFFIASFTVDNLYCAIFFSNCVIFLEKSATFDSNLANFSLQIDPGGPFRIIFLESQIT
nr:hypothetical protein KBIHDJOI_00052 [Spodoptera littoralis nucleopolyhedrovirus]